MVLINRFTLAKRQNLKSFRKAQSDHSYKWFFIVCQNEPSEVFNKNHQKNAQIQLNAQFLMEILIVSTNLLRKHSNQQFYKLRQIVQHHRLYKFHDQQ